MKILMQIALWLGTVAAGQTIASPSVTVGGRPLRVQVVRAPVSAFELRPVLAGPRVASGARVSDILARSGGVCAINGTFLAAYQGQSGEPYGTVIVGGKALHLGTVGTRLEVGPGGPRFVRDGWKISGSLDGRETSPNNWYAYNINQTPGNANYAYIYTPEYGPRLGFVPELAVVVQGGVVASVQPRQAVQIPSDGWVLALNGTEAAQLGGRFRTGQAIAYTLTDRASGAPLTAGGAIGAGPRLVQGGRVVVDPAGEGFAQDKILTARGARSAIGITAGGDILLAAFPAASVREAAEAMRALGATEAMNLDGGASSQLACTGRVLAAGGRPVANALVLFKK